MALRIKIFHVKKAETNINVLKVKSKFSDVIFE